MALKFGQIGSTRMMCPNMKTEQMVLGVLDKVTSDVYKRQVLNHLFGGVTSLSQFGFVVAVP